MISDNTLVSVRNRNNGFTGYSIPDKGIWRNFAPGEVKKISLEELKSLQFVPGGDYTLENYLVVEDTEALKALNMETEPEYSYTEQDIRNLLFTGTLDQLKDFLDFAPDGAIDIAKNIAVKEAIPDVRKRDIISKATGFNINSAIIVNQVMDEEGETKTEEAPKKRRTAPITTAADVRPSAPSKPATPNYKVVG